MADIKGFFFDLDDTLVGTKDANFHAYKDAFADAGLELSYDEFSAHWGKDSKQFIPEIAPQLSVDQVDYIRSQKSEYYGKYLHKTTPNHTLISFLEAMSKHYVTVLVTTAKRRNASEILHMHNLKDLFTHTIFGDDVEQGKPHPEPYLKALNITGFSPEEVVVFEDSNNGLTAARAAGLSAIQIKAFE